MGNRLHIAHPVFHYSFLMTVVIWRTKIILFSHSTAYHLFVVSFDDLAGIILLSSRVAEKKNYVSRAMLLILAMIASAKYQIANGLGTFDDSR